MKRLSELMRQLVAVVEEAVTRPVARVESITRADFAELAAEIRRIHALPAEHVRCSHAAIAVLELIEGYERVKPTDQANGMPWLMLIGATLPLLRAEAWRQLCAEREMPRG